MHVGLITYQIGHRKTFEVSLKLLTKGMRVTLFAFPFVKRPPKAENSYSDRPSQILSFDVETFCKSYGIGYRPVEGWKDQYSSAFGWPGEPDAPDVILHCTAKIVPRSFIEGRTILNAHPGLLPENRGVDAFKWSIVNHWPIGVTLHVIDEEIDRGVILYRRSVPILQTDTLPDVCLRAYNFEVDMLANFDVHLANRERNWQVGDGFPVSHAKIPKEAESRIEELFVENRQALIAAAQKSF